MTVKRRLFESRVQTPHVHIKTILYTDSMHIGGSYTGGLYAYGLYAHGQYIGDRPSINGLCIDGHYANGLYMTDY